jgi:hypothetical protein
MDTDCKIMLQSIEMKDIGCSERNLHNIRGTTVEDKCTNVSMTDRRAHESHGSAY